MAISSAITADYVLKAIEKLRTDGVPRNRKSTKYDLHWAGEILPPKYLLAVANKVVHGKLGHGFRGGAETNNFLIARGFSDIRDKLGRRIAPQAEDEDDSAFYPEGKSSYKLHRTIERSSKLVKTVKNLRLAKFGDLACEVCGFSFFKTYGPIGAGFIEAHHTVPISALKGRRYTRIDEIALVCPNCHRMLHRTSPLLTPAELRAKLKKAAKAATGI